MSATVARSESKFFGVAYLVFIGSLVTALLVILLCGITGLRVNFSTIDGQKIGQVFTLNQSGFLKKTWEAELVRGGLNNGSGAFGVKPFDFTVPDNLVDLVTKYQQSQTEVVITYHQDHIYWYWNSENDGIFLTTIRPAH